MDEIASALPAPDAGWAYTTELRCTDEGALEVRLVSATGDEKWQAVPKDITASLPQA